MRQLIIPVLPLCAGAVTLTACTTVPESSPPPVLQGKKYKKPADELPQSAD